MSVEFYWIAVVAVLVVAAARITRFVIADKFPPMKRLRYAYEEAVEGKNFLGTGWEWLTMCGYCFSFWATWPLIGWAYLAGIFDGPGPVSTAEVVWWLVCGTLAAMYAAAMVVANDGDKVAA